MKMLDKLCEGLLAQIERFKDWGARFRKWGVSLTESTLGDACR